MKTTRKYGKKADLALSLWVKLGRAFAAFNKRTIEDIRRYNLTEPQFDVLQTLGHLGPLTFGQLCDKLFVSGGNMTVVVDNLEKSGIVERVPSASDRRVKLVQLTAKGKKLFDEVFVQHIGCVQKIASILTEREQQQLSRLLKKLGLGIKEMT